MWRAGFLLGLLGLAFPLTGISQPNLPLPAPFPAQGALLPPPASGRLTEPSKLAIVRNVDGEYAKVIRPLPSIKSGFLLKPGEKIDDQALQAALIQAIPAANPGDTVQITSIQFHSREITVNIDGGSHPNESWRDRIHVSVGMPFPTSQVSSNEPPGLQKRGATLILDFGRDLPDVSPDQVKQYLSPFLNFAGEHSAAKEWVDTIPPRFRQAIQEHKAVIGMNQEMVKAALGPADRKVREFRSDGTETEDWIYGDPPATTIFVTFVGDKVVQVKQYF